MTKNNLEEVDQWVREKVKMIEANINDPEYLEVTMKLIEKEIEIGALSSVKNKDVGKVVMLVMNLIVEHFKKDVEDED